MTFGFREAELDDIVLNGSSDFYQSLIKASSYPASAISESRLPSECCYFYLNPFNRHYFLIDLDDTCTS